MTDLNRVPSVLLKWALSFVLQTMHVLSGSEHCDRVPVSPTRQLLTQAIDDLAFNPAARSGDLRHPSALDVPREAVP